MRPAIIIEDAADPDQPNRTIRRARVSDPLRRMDLSDREWAAAERLRADHDLATGYREGDGQQVRVDRSPLGGAHYTDMQLDALRHMARISGGLVMSRGQWDVAQYVVLEWHSLSYTATGLRIDRDTVARRLRAGLKALTEYYG